MLADARQVDAARPPRGVAPAEALLDQMPSRPLLISPQEGWRGVTLQHYRHPPAAVRLSARADHMLVVNIAGKALLDDRSAERRQTRWAEAGCFSLTPAGRTVVRRWQGRPEILLIGLRSDFLGEVAGDAGLSFDNVSLLPRLAVRDPTMHTLGRLLLAEATNPEAGAPAMVDALSRALAIHLLRHHTTAAPTCPQTTTDPPAGRLARAVELMRRHLDQPLPLSRLAATCGLSTTHFARAFREEVGKPPHAYLIDLRLAAARDLLEETDLPIIDVALRCGFEQPQHFATTFRRRVGFTPLAWRLTRRR